MGPARPAHSQVWSADTLGLICEARHAHGGDKVHCLVVAANNVLYTGGDDKVGWMGGGG